VGKILLVVACFAVVVYGLLWLYERRRARKSARSTGQRRTLPKRTLGPDDDEEFLRQIEQRRRRAVREQQAKKRRDDEGKEKKDQPGT